MPSPRLLALYVRLIQSPWHSWPCEFSSPRLAGLSSNVVIFLMTPLTCPWNPASPYHTLSNFWHFSHCCVRNSQLFLLTCPVVFHGQLAEPQSLCPLKKETKNDPLWKLKLMCLLCSPRRCQFQILGIKGVTISHKLEKRFCSPFFSEVWILILLYNYCIWILSNSTSWILIYLFLIIIFLYI